MTRIDEAKLEEFVGRRSRPGGGYLRAAAARRRPAWAVDAFRTGAGVGWEQNDERLFSGVRRLFRPGYAAHLTTTWIPVLDALEDNLTPVGRAFHGLSTVICTPTSLAQPVGLGLGAQADQARLTEVLTRGVPGYAGPPRRRST